MTFRSLVRPPSWRLLLPATMAPVVETALLRALGAREASSLGPQVTALPPFDLFHDLRWISTYHDSWPVLALEVVAAIALRSAWVAWAVHVSWPTAERPPMPKAALRAATFYALAVLLLLPWVLLLFGMALTHLSDLFFAGLPPAVAVAGLLCSGAFRQAVGGWWRWAPSLRALALAGATFLMLTTAGALIASAPVPAAVLVAAVAGAANAWIVSSLVGSIAGERTTSWRRHVLVPVALATTFAVALGGAALGFRVNRTPAAAGIAVRLPAHAEGRPVLVVSGFASRWTLTVPFVLPSGFVAWRYSYRGMQGRTMLPYAPSDTLQPLRVSADRMAAQVAALHDAYGGPVTIVAESEGAMVARDYLLERYRPESREVTMLIVLDMPAGASSVTYPPVGVQGLGVGTGWGLRGLAHVIRWLGHLEVTADAPLLREMADCPGLMRRIGTAPPPEGVRQVTIHALADAVDGPPISTLPPGQAFVIPAGHGNLLSNPTAQRLVDAVLSGTAPVPPSPLTTRSAAAVAALAEPWQTPALPPSLQIDHGAC